VSAGLNRSYDAIVIGGGHNGLVNAAYLARAGLEVLVLERRHLVGGAAVTEELYPGFKYSVCSYVVSLLRPEIIRDLELARHGLQILPLESTLNPLPDGNYLARWADPEQTYRELSRFSRKDAETYCEFGQNMVQLARFAKPILSMTPPNVAAPKLADAIQMLGLGNRFRKLEQSEIFDQLRMFSMSAVDFLDTWFECAPLKAAMSVSGIIGTFLGVRSPGTAYVLLHHYMGEIDGALRSWGLARGGMGALSDAIASSARAHGARIVTEAPIEQVIVEGGRARGVVLENGREVRSKLVVSSLDPHRTFIRLVGAQYLDSELVSGIQRYKFRGSSGKVNLALDRAPEFACLPGDGPHLKGSVAIAPSIDYLETAYDEAKYGSFSRRPFLDIVMPSFSDPSVAPPGKHVMSIFVQYAPYQLKGAPWPEQREAFGDTVIETLAEYCPGIADSILHRQVLTPWDLEQQFGLTEGNIFHGEMSLEQLFFNRPLPGCADYRTPIGNLYLCGSGNHPGGGVMGAPGMNAAREILSDLRRFRGTGGGG